jgi:hypothetical protein
MSAKKRASKTRSTNQSTGTATPTVLNRNLQVTPAVSRVIEATNPSPPRTNPFDPVPTPTQNQAQDSGPLAEGGPWQPVASARRNRTPASTPAQTSFDTPVAVTYVTDLQEASYPTFTSNAPSTEPATTIQSRLPLPFRTPGYHEIQTVTTFSTKKGFFNCFIVHTGNRHKPSIHFDDTISEASESEVASSTVTEAGNEATRITDRQELGVDSLSLEGTSIDPPSYLATATRENRIIPQERPDPYWRPSDSSFPETRPEYYLGRSSNRGVSRNATSEELFGLDPDETPWVPPSQSKPSAYVWKIHDRPDNRKQPPPS